MKQPPATRALPLLPATVAALMLAGACGSAPNARLGATSGGSVTAGDTGDAAESNGKAGGVARGGSAGEALMPGASGSGAALIDGGMTSAGADSVAGGAVSGFSGSGGGGAAGLGGGVAGQGGASVQANCRVREFGDQGDGTYINQILPGDYQNTDVIRVDDDYYYITATKSLSPGMQILHSKDLVNWTPIGHVVTDITVFNRGFAYDRMQGATRGIWAGSIAHHAGQFYVYFTTPDEGLYVSSAADPAGPWSPLTHMIDGPGWDDPAPLWDDDGQGYLAATRFGADPKTNVTYNIHLFKLSSDGKSMTGADTVIYRGQGSEANKLFKLNGYYYHFFSQVIGEGRAPFVRRAKVITGPYEAAHQINHVTAADREPNQGSILQTAAGDWVFITHHGNADWYGRGASLLPVTWTDGWPAAGRVGADGIGNMVATGKKPVAGYPVMTPRADDDFASPTLAPQWEWFFQPRGDHWSLSERPGFLRLHAFKPLAAGDLSKTGNVLTQRPLRAAKSTATVVVDVSHMVDGQVAGLGFLGNSWAAVGVLQEQGVRHFVYTQSGRALVRGAVVPAGQATVSLRTSWDAKASATFSVSTDRITYLPLGSAFAITNFGNYMGAKLALYTANDQADAGYVDIDEFTYPCNGN